MMIFLVIFLFVLPFFFMTIHWRAKFSSKFEWGLDALVTILLVSWIFQTGAWSWTGYYFKWFMLGLLFIALTFSWRKARLLPFKIDYTKKKKFSLTINRLLILVFGLYNFIVFTSYSTNDTRLGLTFPMQEGQYLIVQGGNQTQMNYHQAYEPQQYALDIVALNDFGARAKGIYPKNLERYEIYGHSIESPCTGVVSEAEDGLPDLIPPETDSENPTGNYVALTCDYALDTIVYLAHMQEGSVTVEAGVQVEVGQLLGKVGNSGNTSEPHLHIHAEKAGFGVPLEFDGRFLVRNQLVRTK